MTYWNIFPIFPRKQVLTFHENCLQWRQFAGNVKNSFLGKIKKIYMKLSSAKLAQRMVKVKRISLFYYLCVCLKTGRGVANRVDQELGRAVVGRNDVNTVHHPLHCGLEELLTLSLLVATSVVCSFADSLDPDQARQNVGPNLDPNCYTLWWYS